MSRKMTALDHMAQADNFRLKARYASSDNARDLYLKHAADHDRLARELEDAKSKK